MRFLAGPCSVNTLQTPVRAPRNSKFAMTNPAFAAVTALPLGRPFSGSAISQSRSSPSLRPSSSRRARLSPCAQAESTMLTIDELKDRISVEVAAGKAAVAAAQDERGLNDVRVTYMGKKGKITAFMKTVGQVPKEDRPKLGAVVNVAKDEMSDLIAARKKTLAADALQKELDSRPDFDVTVPGLRMRPRIGRMHPLTSTMEKAVDVFVDLGYDVIDELSPYNREIEEDYYCFESLNCPADHPARDMQDTLFLKEDKSFLLRTQTSAMQVRYMKDHKPPFAIIAPGRVYRRDSVDATHTPMFHQVEILHVRKAGELTLGGLRATVIHFLEQMFGKDIETRFRGSFFPFTEPSMEVDVFFRGRWLEVLGCGMVDPNVLENVGIDPNEYVGFAAGFGVERFAMVIHEVPDIREFYRSDLRFLDQFAPDMESYEPQIAEDFDVDSPGIVSMHTPPKEGQTANEDSMKSI